MKTEIEHVSARAYRIPTDAPEADGTLEWDSTVLILVEVKAGGQKGLGYSYASPAAAQVVADPLCTILKGRDAFAVEAAYQAMIRSVRNLGWRGVAANAISAVDVALWDLKARLLDCSLYRLLGAARQEVQIYGSGGFTSYSSTRLAEQLASWVHDEGCEAVKMKVGANPEADCERMQIAKEAIGAADLMIDANGAFTPKQALYMAEIAADFGVIWFEEPVSSDDLDGLSLLRQLGPVGMDIAAGEYGYEPIYFRRMIEARCIDVLQIDATRCCGYTGFLRAAALADAYGLPISAHTAPALHLPVCAAAPRLMHLEWFHDHVRIERRLFDGAPVPRAGCLVAESDRPGHGLVFRSSDAEEFAL